VRPTRGSTTSVAPLARSVAGSNVDPLVRDMKQWRSELRCYRRLTRRKRAQFWHASVEEQSSSPRRLWRSIDQLIGREKQAGSPDILAADLQDGDAGAQVLK